MWQEVPVGIISIMIFIMQGHKRTSISYAWNSQYSLRSDTGTVFPYVNNLMEFSCPNECQITEVSLYHTIKCMDHEELGLSGWKPNFMVFQAVWDSIKLQSFKISYLTEFFTDWLTDCLMPIGLIFSLLGIVCRAKTNVLNGTERTFSI